MTMTDPVFLRTGNTRRRSSELDLTRYDTDKIENRYLDIYDSLFADLVDAKITLLELGVLRGGSLELWADYFPEGTLVGVDANVPDEVVADRIVTFKCLQQNCETLADRFSKEAPNGFDIIIDDASHIATLTRKSFRYLFDNHLKDEGLFIIEDWTTGYWDDWPDGRSYTTPSEMSFRLLDFLRRLGRRLGIKLTRRYPNHSYGMVGFIKELIDEQGAADAQRRNLANRPNERSKFEWLLVFPSIVVVKKVNQTS